MQFRGLALDRLKSVMAQPVSVDPRYIYRPEDVAAAGFVYESVGIEASSLSTSSVALYWRVEPGKRPAPGEVRDAAHWLEMLADALETEIVSKQQPY